MPLLTFDGSDPRRLEAGLASARRAFGTTDVVTHRSVAVPGSVETVDYRAQDPGGAYGDVLLALRRGSYPTGPRQVAVTDGVADLLRLDIGSTLALDGQRRTVVGIVENPRKLSDEFALVSPSSASTADYVSVLVDSTDESLESFFGRGPDSPPAFAGAQVAGSDNPEAPVLAMFSVTTVFLLLASLVAAAGFAVVAQRRLRHLGMLAAVGATEKQLRLVLLANGAIVGAIAALVGTAVGLAAGSCSAGTRAGSRPSRRPAQPSLVADRDDGTPRHPRRNRGRLVAGPDGRPPPDRARALGTPTETKAGAPLRDRGRGADHGRRRLSRALRPGASAPHHRGIVATIVGCLLLGPLAIRVFSSLAGRVSIAPRLALRDLVRHQARSGAALAAVTLALGIAATIVVIASAEEAKSAAEPPTCRTDRSGCTSACRTPGSSRRSTHPLSCRVERERPSARRRARQRDGDPLRKASSRARRGVIGDTQVLLPSELARRSTWPAGRKRYERQCELYVATPAMLGYLGVDPARSIRARTSSSTERPDRRLVIPSMTSRGEIAVTNVQRIDIGRAPLRLGDSAGRRRASSPSVRSAATAGSTSRPAGSSSRAGR